MPLRSLLLVLLAVSSAEAAEAPADEAVSDERGGPREPMKPEDAIPVVGIVCYTIVPAIIVITISILASAWVRGRLGINGIPALEALSNPALHRGLPAPPRGVILFRF